MLFTNIEITFSYDAGAETQTLTASKVEFGLELIGQIDENFDYTLSEAYEDARQTIEVSLLLDQAQSIWMKNFLIAADKVITMDDVEYEVANADLNISFPLYKGTKLGTFPKLKFRRKELGVLDPSVYIGEV